MDDLQHAYIDAQIGDSPPGADGGLADLEQYIQSHQERLRNVQQTLREQIEKLAEELDGEDIRAVRQEVIAQRVEVEQKTERLTQLRTELEQLQTQFAKAQEQFRDEQQASHERLQTWETELEARSNELTEELARLRESQRELALLREEFTVDAQNLARGRERLAEKMRLLDEQQDKLAAERQLLLEQMDQERAAHREERNRLQALAEQSHPDLPADISAELQILRDELDECRRQLDERTSELLQAQADKLEVEEKLCAAASSENDQQRQELDETCRKLQSQLDELTEQYAELQAELEHAQSSPGSGEPSDLQQALEDLQARYEMAIDDLRNERARSVSLEDRLASPRSGKPVADSGGMDWESQKRRLLAALEADFDSDDEEDVADRITIEDVLRRTDAAVVSKEQEIAELRELLNQQSANIGNVAVGAAAIAELLDQDELIQQERENLERLKVQLEEKSRKAEIELSMERAAIARERQLIEEKTRLLNEDLEQLRKGKPQTADNHENDSKVQRGRWFKRLGLKDDDKK